MAALAAGLVLGSAVLAADMPRLAGVVIAPGRRIALFDTGTGVLTPVDEGDEVTGYRVRSIGPGGVQLERDGLLTVLHTRAAAAAAEPVDTGGVTFGRVLRTQPPSDD